MLVRRIGPLPWIISLIALVLIRLLRGPPWPPLVLFFIPALGIGLFYFAFYCGRRGRAAALDLAIWQGLIKAREEGSTTFNPEWVYQRYIELMSVGSNRDMLSTREDEVSLLRGWLEKAAELARTEGYVPSAVHPNRVIRW